MKTAFEIPRTLRERKTIRSDHHQILSKITAVERAVLGFQASAMRAVGSGAAEDTNTAIILAARLAAVWRRVGTVLSSRR